jgi:hypothetical protein
LSSITHPRTVSLRPSMYASALPPNRVTATNRQCDEALSP